MSEELVKLAVAFLIFCVGTSVLIVAVASAYNTYMVWQDDEEPTEQRKGAS